MKESNNRAHDLFLLMFNISQLTNREKIIDFFVQALAEIWPEIRITFHLLKPGDENNIIEISSSNAQYGSLQIDNFTELEIEEQNLLQNAVALLAIILKKNEQDKLLENEKLHLQNLVDEKLEIIKESEGIFRNVFDYSIVGKSITKIGGKIEANKAFCDMLGYSNEELSTTSWQEITHPDEIERDQKFIDSIISGKHTSMRWEKRYIHKDGHFVWTDLSTVLHRDKQRNPLYFITTVIDITEHKFAVEILQESEERYRSLFENMLNGFAYCQMLYEDGRPVDFIYLDVNSAFESLTGLKNVVGKKVSDVIPGIKETDNNLFEIYGRVALNDIPESFEIYMESLNDWYSVTVYSPKKEYFVAIFDVITERKQTNEKLSRSEERFRTSLDNMMEGCQILDFNWKYLYINHTADIHNRRPKEDLLGNTYMEMWPGIEQTKVFQVIKDTLENRTSNYMENEFQFPSGKKGWFELRIYPVPEGVFILSIDITERKLAEEALQHSEAKYRELFNNAEVGMYLLKMEGTTILAVNRKLCKIFGYTEQEMLDNPATIRWADINARTKMVENLREKGVLHDYEMDILTKKGEIRHLLISVHIYPELGYLEGSAIDITDRKRNEESYRETNEYLENLIKYANAPIIVWDSSLKIDRFNKAFENISGFTSAEIIGKRVDALFPKDKIKQSLELINETAAGKRWETVEIEILRKDGEIRTVLWNSANIYNEEHNNIVSTIAQGNDITERKRIEETLRETNEYLENLFRYANAPIIVWDTQYHITRFNPAFENLTGRKVKDVIGKSIEILFPKELVESSMKLIRKTQEGERWVTVEIHILHQDGSIRIVLWNSASVLASDGTTIIATIAQGHDISKRIVSEKALKESETKFKAIFENSHDAIGVSKNGLTIFVNPAYLKLFGFENENEIIDKSILEQISPKEHQRILNYIQKRNAGEVVPKFYETIGKRINGDEFPFECAIDTYLLNNEKYTIVIIRDITERKEAEEALKRSEQLYRAIGESIDYGVWVCEPDGRNIYASESFLNMVGITQEQCSNFGWGDVLHPDDSERTIAAWKECVQTGNNWDIEHRFRGVDGLWHYVLARGVPVRDENGQIISWAGINLDVTDRKRVDEEIKNNEKQFRELIESLPQLFWTCKANGPCDYLSKQWVEYTGIPETEQLGYRWLEQLHPEDKDRTVFQWMEKVKTGNSFDIEFRIRRNDGEYHWFKTTAVPMCDTERNIVKWFGSNTDFDDIKKAEVEIKKLNETLEKRVIERTAELKESEERFRQLAEASYEAIIIHDRGILLRANDQFYKLFGFKPEEMLGKQVMPMTTAPHSLKVLSDQIAVGGTGPYTATGLRKDGTTFPMEVRARNMEYKGLNVRVAAILDITLRVKAEKELRERTIELESANKELEKAKIDLESKNAELTRFNKLFVGRELRIKELKNKISLLEEKNKNS